MIRLIVGSGKLVHTFIARSRSLRNLFIATNRFRTDVTFLLDENNVLLVDEDRRALVD